MDTASGINTPESPASPEGVRSVEETAIPRFECPPNFQQVEISAEDEPLYLEDIKGTTELWLIKTPQDFDVKRLNSKTLSLSGRQFLDETEESDVSYEVLTSYGASSDKKSLPRLLVPSKHCADLVPAPSFSGQLAIMESVAVPPVLLPPSPPPRLNELPPGLKQRFLPFGWEQPKRPSVDTADIGPVETEPKKKKKSQKDKKHNTTADITQSNGESKPQAKQGDTQGGDDRLAGEGEVEDDRVMTKAHRKGKKRKQQRRVQNDDTVNQSPVNAEETQPLKKKKKHKK